MKKQYSIRRGNLKQFWILFTELTNSLNLTRLCNLMLLAVSYVTQSFRVKGLPFCLGVEPSTYCNLECPVCPLTKGIERPKGNMSLTNFKKLIDELSDSLFVVILYGCGEPMLNKDIYEMVKYARQRNIFTIISTNGMFINAQKLIESGLDYCIFALDGSDEESYLIYRRGGNFNKVLENIRELVREKECKGAKLPFIDLRCLVMKHNEHQREDMKKLAHKLKVDFLSFKTFGIIDDEDRRFLPVNVENVRKVYRNPSLVQNMANNQCQQVFSYAEVTWDGRVIPCCADYQAKYSFGNAFVSNFREIWNNSKYVTFRKSIWQAKSRIPLCNNCLGRNVFEMAIQNLL